MFRTEGLKKLFRRRNREARGHHAARKFSLENLESRELLSGEPWSQQSKSIAQDLAAANFPTITGAGQAIAIIDSGVDYNHPALGGGFGDGKKVVAGYDFQDYDANPMSDTFAHGTGVAGIAAANSYVYNGQRYQGIAPGARVIALRENGTAGVKAALEWVLANRAKYNIVAVNMTDFGGGSALTYKAVLKSLISAGVFVTHPAGNNGTAAPVSAALDPADFAIGSVNLAGQISSFSQRGAELDLLAPGEGVTMPYYDVASRKHTTLASSHGTSWAAPGAAGAAALIKQIDPRFTPAEIMKILQDSGTATYDAATKLTYKRLNLNAALGLAYQRSTKAPQAPGSSGPIAVPAQSAFNGTKTINGQTTIQAEDFDNGGQNVSFFDTDAANVGGSTYRNGTPVDVENGANGTKFVGHVRAGEWLEYTVNVATAGTYSLSARVASLKAGGKFHVEVDGADKTGQLAVPDTKGWQNWTTVSKSGVALTAGTHVIRIKADAAGQLGYVANFDSITLAPTATQSAFSTINATKYSAQSGVSNNGAYVGSMDQGDWVAYNGVDFGEGAKTLTVSLAVAAGWQGKKIQFRLGSPTGAVIGTITVPNTNGWTNFKSVTVAISGATKVQNLYVTVTGGAGGAANLQSLRFG